MTSTLTRGAETRLTPCHVPRARHAAAPEAIRAALNGDVLATFTEAEYRKPIFVRRALLRRIVFVNSPALVREAFVANHSALNRKSPQLRHAFEPLIDDGVFIGHGKTWEARRPPIARILHLKNTPAFFPSIVDEVEHLAAQWASAPGKEVDLLQDTSLLALNVVARALFGERLGTEDANRLIAAFSEFGQKMDHLDLPSLLKLPDWVSRLSHRRLQPVTDQILDVVDRLIDRCLAGNGSTTAASAFVAQMQDARDADGNPFDRRAIRNEAVGALLAGYETTGATMAFALYLLSEAPWAAKELQSELDAVLCGNPPSLADLGQLTYTRAVISETLRLYPPVHMIGREASRSFSVGGVKVRKGDQVVAAPYLMHRNPDLYENPDEFMPERFLPDAKPVPKNAYIPFALGPRVCPGMMFANCEIAVALAVFMERFKFAYAGKEPLKPVTHGTLRPGATLQMHVLPRERGKQLSSVDKNKSNGDQTVTTCPFSSATSTDSSSAMAPATASSVTN